MPATPLATFPNSPPQQKPVPHSGATAEGEDGAKAALRGDMDILDPPLANPADTRATIDDLLQSLPPVTGISVAGPSRRTLFFFFFESIFVRLRADYPV